MWQSTSGSPSTRVNDCARPVTPGPGVIVILDSGSHIDTPFQPRRLMSPDRRRLQTVLDGNLTSVRVQPECSRSELLLKEALEREGFFPRQTP